MAIERRVTMNLDPRGCTNLDDMVTATGYNATDVIHRALALYHLYETARADGAELIIRRNGADEIIRIL